MWLLATVTGAGLSSVWAGEIGGHASGPEPTLRGLVLTTNNIPITNATVTVKGVLAGRGTVYVFDAPDCNRQALTMADGSFAIKGLVADTKFEGVVTAPGFEPWEFYDADPAAEPLEVKMPPAPADDPQQTVHGRVVNADGKPEEGAKIEVYMLHTESGWHSGGGLAYTDQRGEFAFQPRENIIACSFTIQADGCVSRSFDEVPPGASTNVYQLSQGASLTGRLMKDGKPVPDAGIGIYGLNGGNFINRESVVTDSNGRFTFSGLPPHEKFYLFGIMRSLRDLGALPRRQIETRDAGTLIDLGDLNLVKGYTIAGRVQMADGKPAHVAAFTLARTELTPPTGRAPTAREESNRSFYGLEQDFDDWRVYPGPDGKFKFTGVPGETVSIFLMLKPFDMLSSRNVSSDGKGFRLLGVVVSNKTDLVIEIEPHSRQIFPSARDYEVLSRQPLQGAEASLAK